MPFQRGTSEPKSVDYDDGGPRLHATTVRFHAESWDRLGREAKRLGVARSTLIREATEAHLTRSPLEADLRELRDRVERIEAVLSVVVAAVRRLRRWLR